jgi:exopolyphosphatase/guanosine-5'-triphosphate,3'-diphosphate pyrophosphatase
MGQQAVKVGAVDIGTNSMRLLITDGAIHVGRWEEVTGLGRGVDRTGALSQAAISTSIDALEGFGRLMASHGVARRKAIATSASREASNREAFFDLAERALGVRPTLIDGQEEARLAYEGATAHLDPPRPLLVSDIGGGSTEFVTATAAVSVDIGSVRITERAVPSRPAPAAELSAAREMIGEMFSSVRMGAVGTLIGVAGTWTELPALARGLPGSTDTHGMTVTRQELANVIDTLSELSVEATADLPSLNPKRAPVILGGALVAEGVMDTVGAEKALASIEDSLDGLAMTLLALA